MGLRHQMPGSGVSTRLRVDTFLILSCTFPGQEWALQWVLQEALPCAPPRALLWISGQRTARSIKLKRLQVQRFHTTFTPANKFQL
jgi:hypothetical protein